MHFHPDVLETQSKNIKMKIKSLEIYYNQGLGQFGFSFEHSNGSNNFSIYMQIWCWFFNRGAHPPSFQTHIYLWIHFCVYLLCLWQVLENYNKGKTALLSAAKIMVSPTEVDLNPETMFVDTSTTSQQPSPTPLHRRNSSVRFVSHALLWACLSLKASTIYNIWILCAVSFLSNFVRSDVNP